MDHSIESIYYDLLDREMSDRGQPMSLWGPGHTLYKPTTTSAQVSLDKQRTLAELHVRIIQKKNRLVVRGTFLATS